MLIPESAGYATILVGGAFFAVVTNALTWIQRRYTRFDPAKIDEFSSASRSVKTGMLSVGITSAWVWAALFLQTGTLTYLYGVSIPWWFGMGGFVEIAAFAFISSKVKVNAGGASTFLQVAKVRFGKLGHFSYMFAALVANFVVGSEVLTGGAGVISGMTGINQIAAVWLLPTVIVAYVLTGGLRATFVADYLHCCILYTCLLVLVIGTYTRGSLIGSPSRLYDLLQEASEISPAIGNAHQSYLSFRSEGGMYYAIIAATSFFGLSFCDQSYWQRSIASRPAGTSKAFIFAGCFFFAAAFGVGSSMGLAARALGNDPAFPTYPNPMSLAEIGAGLAGPYASVAVLGKAGPAMYTIIAFMATTSAFSAQLVAVSTIVSYDVYREYFRPTSSNKEMMRVSHATVIGWAVFMAAINTVFAHIGLNLNFLFYFMAVSTSGSVFPIALLMCWRKLSKAGAVAGVFGGLIVGYVAWFVSARALEGEISIITLTSNPVILAGSLSAIGTGALLSVGISLISPADFDFGLTRAIGRANVQEALPEEPTNSLSHDGGGESELANATLEKGLSDIPKTTDRRLTAAHNVVQGGGRTIIDDAEYDEGVRKLEASQGRFRLITAAFLFVILVLIPVPLAATGVVYSRALFTLQCVAAAAFASIAAVLIIFWPIVESLSEIKAIIGRVKSNRRLDTKQSTEGSE